MTLHQTPLQNAPVAAGSIADGSLMSAAQLAGLGVPLPPAGAGYGPGYSGTAAGLPVNPAGMSLPGGPMDPMQDPTSLALLAQASRNANAGASPAAPAPMLAGFPMWAVAGLGVAALAMLLKGGPSGPTMSMGQGWQLPVRRSRRASRRR
jgi:hypothetical protein